MGLSQTDRLMRITTPLNENTFVVLSFTGTESLSKPFLFDLQLASEKSDIAFDRLAGKSVTVEIGGGRAVKVQNSESHTNGAGFTHKVAANYVLKVNGNITIDASGIVSINGAKIILNG